MMNELSGGLEAGINAMSVEVAILDDSGTIVLVNDAWRQFADENHDTNPDYWLDENYIAICEQSIDSPQAMEVSDHLRRILAGDTDRALLEYPCHSPDQQRWFQLEAAGFTHNDDQHILISHTNITDQKRAEQRAEAQSTQLDTLLGVLSHDIRNPLQVIDGYASVLAEDLDDAEELDSIQQAAARITEITESTLEFTGSGALTSVEPLSLAGLAQDIWADVATPEMTLTIRDSSTIHGDKRLFCQLFENIFRNARDHAGHDCNVTIGTLPNGFYVEDDGPGIPTEIQEKALAADFSTRGTGGLGLAIVQTVIKAHDAELRITDADSGGARLEMRGFSLAPQTPFNTPSTSTDSGQY